MSDKKKKWVREEQCRTILEKIYCEEFPSCRPDFLVNPETKKCLELDCYNQRLGIACEYNGIQHYEYPNIYHKSVQQFKDQMRRDKFKEKVCKENGILLIVIPYTVTNLQTYIEERICRYTKLLIKKKILTKIDLTDCTILKDYLSSRLKISSTISTASVPKISTKSASNTKSKISTKSVPKTKTNTKSKASTKDKSSTKTRSKNRSTKTKADTKVRTKSKSKSKNKRTKSKSDTKGKARSK